MVKGILSRYLKVVDRNGKINHYRLHLVTFNEIRGKNERADQLPVELEDFSIIPFISESPGIIYVDFPLLLIETSVGSWSLSRAEDSISEFIQ